jgi:hypothetical protein
MSKTIQINPDLFRLSSKGGRKKGNKTEKNREDGEPGGIKIRGQTKERGKSTKTIRKDLLKFIRKQQEKNFKHLIQSDQNIIDKSSGEKEFNSDFDESLQYLMEIAKQNEPTTAAVPANHTFRNRLSLEDKQTRGGDFIGIELPETLYSTQSDTFKDQTTPYHYGSSLTLPSIEPPRATPMQLLPPPAYGCLKGGQLPTYRTYQNMTQKIRQPIGGGVSTQPNFPQNVSAPPPPPALPPHPFLPPSFNYGEGVSVVGGEGISKKDILEQARLRSKEKTKRMVAEIKAGAEIQRQKKPKSALRYLKQRKTIRRTYAVGKSRFQPKVGVLISNKTIRNHITTQSQLLKQTPIQEIRAFLVKKGFIKVGTAAPNDVLRKIYESVFLVCGDVENHNSENLLYNYFNEKP